MAVHQTHPTAPIQSHCIQQVNYQSDLCHANGEVVLVELGKTLLRAGVWEQGGKKMRLRVLPAYSFSSAALPQPAPAPPFVRTPRQRWRRASRPRRLPHQQLPLLVQPGIFHSVVDLILFSPLLDLLRACAAAPPVVPLEAGGSKWVPGGVIAKVHLIIFLSNGTPLIQFKWDGFGSPI